MSVAMLKADVAGREICQRPIYRKATLVRLTVEEGCGVDTVPSNHSCQVPHLVERDALDKAADNADDNKNGQ